MKLSVCAIFKDEAPYLREWVEFHQLQGVDQFYLYDHQSLDGSREVVQELQAAGAPIELVAVTGGAPQMPIYSACLLAHRDDDWIAFIDIDEFLYSPDRPIKDVLDIFGDYSGVVANWAIYGPGGHDRQPVAGVVESYLWRADEGFGPNVHVKSIVQPAKTLEWPISDPHSFSYAEGFAVGEDGVRVDGPFRTPVSWDLLRVNHYWSKSVEEAKRKTAKPRADCLQPRSPLEALIGPETSAIFDDSAVRSLNACLQSRAA